MKKKWIFYSQLWSQSHQKMCISNFKFIKWTLFIWTWIFRRLADRYLRCIAINYLGLLHNLMPFFMRIRTLCELKSTYSMRPLRLVAGYHKQGNHALGRVFDWPSQTLLQPNRNVCRRNLLLFKCQFAAIRLHSKRLKFRVWISKRLRQFSKVHHFD